MQRNLELKEKALYKNCILTLLLNSPLQVNEASTTMGSPGEILSRRCVALLKTALRADVWPNSELKLGWFDKILMMVEHAQPNFANICTALELLSFLLGILVGCLSCVKYLCAVVVVVFGGCLGCFCPLTD